MAIRRRLSFDLLRYDSSGDAEEDGNFVNGNGNAKPGIPTGMAQMLPLHHTADDVEIRV